MVAKTCYITFAIIFTSYEQFNTSVCIVIHNNYIVARRYGIPMKIYTDVLYTGTRVSVSTGICELILSVIGTCLLRDAPTVDTSTVGTHLL